MSSQRTQTGNGACGAGNHARSARHASGRVHGFAHAKGNLRLVPFSLPGNYVVSLVSTSTNAPVTENTCIMVHVYGMRREILSPGPSCRPRVGSVKNTQPPS